MLDIEYIYSIFYASWQSLDSSNWSVRRRQHCKASRHSSYVSEGKRIWESENLFHSWPRIQKNSHTVASLSKSFKSVDSNSASQSRSPVEQTEHNTLAHLVEASSITQQRPCLIASILRACCNFAAQLSRWQLRSKVRMNAFSDQRKETIKSHVCWILQCVKHKIIENWKL